MIIIQYWNTKAVPADVANLIATFPALNPGCDHRLYDEEQADAFIAANFSAREVSAFRSCAVPAMQSDYFRYCALFQLGGIYVDADMKCIGALGALWDLPGTADLYAARTFVYNAPLVFRTTNHPLLALVIEIATANIETKATEAVALATGPQILQILLGMKNTSIQAHLDHIRRTNDVPDRVRLVELIAREVLSNDDEKLAQAFYGVRCYNAKRLADTVALLSPSYKNTEVHWQNWRTSIYR